jgi:hypothetical protein
MGQRSRVPGLADARRVAQELGDLPLALAQTAVFLAETGMPAGQYADLIGTRAAQLMCEGRPCAARTRPQPNWPGCARSRPRAHPADWFPAAAAKPPRRTPRHTSRHDEALGHLHAVTAPDDLGVHGVGHEPTVRACRREFLEPDAFDRGRASWHEVDAGPSKSC